METDLSVVTDGKMITGKGPGVAVDFALEIVARFAARWNPVRLGCDAMPIRDIRLLKTELRQKYKRIRKNLDPEKQRAMDAEIQTRLLALRQYGENDVIFTYLSKPIEVDTFGWCGRPGQTEKGWRFPNAFRKPPKWSFIFITSMDDLAPGAFRRAGAGAGEMPSGHRLQPGAVYCPRAVL